MQTSLQKGHRSMALNINDKVGSTHPEALAEFLKEKGADVGLAFRWRRRPCHCNR